MECQDTAVALGRMFRIATHGLLIGTLLGWLSTANFAQGQMPALPVEASPGPPGLQAPRSAEDEMASLRWQVETMQQRLQSQQVQLDQQAVQFQQLEAQRTTVPTNESAQVSPPGVQAAPDSPMHESADPSVTTPPGIVFPFSRSAEGCYPRAILGGQYRMMFNAANYDYHPQSITDNQQSQAFINQRLRPWLTVQTSDNVEAYVQAQIGHVVWGTDYDLPKTFAAPGTANDQVGVMLRYGYLAYHNDCVGRLQAGIQGWQDSFSQTLFSSDWDFSVGGLSWVRKCPEFGDTQMKFGIFELVEGDAHLVDQSYLLTLDLDRPVGEKNSIGFSAYFLPDRGGYSYPSSVFAPYKSAWDVWLGGRFRLGLPIVPINGFAIYNMGEREDFGSGPTFQHDGVALKLEAGPVPIGPGKVSTQALYSTGGDTPGGGFRTVAQSARDNFGAEGYWSYLMLVAPQGYTDVNDLGVSLQNRGSGLFTVQTKYDYPILKRLSGTIAVGWLRSDTPNPANGSTDMGTEVGNDFTLDFGGGLKADMGAAVLFTGDFYKPSAGAPPPAKLYEAFTRVQLEF
jgi:hypothetical protein